MRGPHARIALLALSLLLAGCAGGDDTEGGSTPTPTTGTTGTGTDGANETEPPPPPRTELLNTSLAYPRAPEGQPASEGFDLPADAIGLRVLYKPIHDCPTPSLGYQEDAALVITDPVGEETTRLLFQAGAGTVDCNNQVAQAAVDFNPVEGTWSVATSGVYTGSVEVVAVANPTSPA